MKGPRPVVAPNVFNALTARLAEAAGFQALYLGGGPLGYLKCITEANISLPEMVDVGIEIRTTSRLPLVLDGTCGWGDPMHMHRTIAMSEAAGFAGIEIEDQPLPKRAHHHIGIEHLIAAGIDGVRKYRRRSAPARTLISSSLGARMQRDARAWMKLSAAGKRTSAREPT